MKKELILVASALAVLAACNRMEQEQVQEQNQNQLTEIPVGFDVYTQRGVSTKAGYAGDVTTDGLKTGATLKDAGFGVFAFYTDNNTYDQQFLPNFMYNEHVAWNGSAWAYAPIKYWPNEYGDRAESDDSDKISFFAYAPWVEVVNTTGKVDGDADLAKWGINSMTRNSASGDPMVKYLVDFDPTHSVDLCWGVANGDAWQVVNGGDFKTITAGKPWLDIERPAKIEQPLKFTFKHALAKLRVVIDADPDITEHNETDAIKAATKVYVRSVSFEGFATKGALNLNNTIANKALWMDYSNNANDLMTGEEITIYDGRKDGKEGTPGGVASNEKQLGLNPQLVQSTILGTAGEPTGVTNVYQNLFHKDNAGVYEAAGVNESVYVIPTGDAVKVTIVYDVETRDDKLASSLSDGQTHGSSVENRITKSITFADGTTSFENGKAYTLKLHLGMNSVKFDADVTAWDEQEEIDVELPSNVVLYAAANPATAKTVEVAADVTSYEFAISGLNASESVSVAGENGNLSAPTTNRANNSGIALESITIASNMTVNEVTSAAVTWTGNSSGKGVELTVKQKPHALGLNATGLEDTDKSIVIAAGASVVVDWSNDVDASDADRFVVKRNGLVLTNEDGLSDDAKFKFDASNKKIVFKSAVTTGDVYEITIQAGDAEAETITVKIGGFSAASGTGSVTFAKSNADVPYTIPVASFIGDATFAYSKTADDGSVSSDPTAAGVATLNKNTANDYSVVYTVTATPEAGTLIPTGKNTYVHTLSVHVTE